MAPEDEGNTIWESTAWKTKEEAQAEWEHFKENIPVLIEKIKGDFTSLYNQLVKDVEAAIQEGKEIWAIIEAFITKIIAAL